MPDHLQDVLLQRAMQPSAAKVEPQQKPWKPSDLDFLSDEPTGVSIPTNDGPAPFGSINYIREMGRLLGADNFDVTNWISKAGNPEQAWNLFNDNEAVYDDMPDEQAGMQRYALIPQELKYMFNSPFEQKAVNPEPSELLRDLEADNDQVYDYMPPDLRDLQIRALLNRKGPK